MAHIRQQMRDAAKAVLIGTPNVITICGARARSFDESELPAISVMTTQETISALDGEWEDLTRDVIVEITAYVMGGDNSDDNLDDICAEIEKRIISASGGVWDALHSHIPQGMEFLVGDEADKPLFVARTRFAFRALSPGPEAIG